MCGKTKSHESVGTPDALRASETVQRYYSPNLMMRAGCLSLLFICAAAACTSFGDEPPEPGANAGVDAGAPADGATSGDGGAAGDAGAGLTFDFENGIGDGWQTIGDRPPQLVGTDCNGGSNKCLESRAKAQEKGYLTRRLPDAPKVRVVAAMRVVTKGDGEIDFFGIRHVSDQGSWIVSPLNGSSYVVESATLGAVPKRNDSTGATFAEWTRVEILLERAPPTATWTIGGSQTAKVTLPITFATGDIELEVGIRYSRLVTNEWVVRFDDIEISTSN